MDKRDNLYELDEPDNAPFSDANPTRSARPNTLKKHGGKLVAVTLLASTILLTTTACTSTNDCTQVFVNNRNVQQPSSSTFTSYSPSNTTGTTGVNYCDSAGSRYYGTSYIYYGGAS